jgi:aspartyl-tRNA(Asn)/glutamyl-tRNA(Gln) amidotransferase subunit B
MSDKYETVIGLEVHSELSTKTKIFCSCRNEFGGEPNTHCCPVCTGMPGVLPVLNKSVVEYAVKAGLATNCEIQKFSKNDRKNFFYPDMPKAYQISQFDLPVCKGGSVEIAGEFGKKTIGITRIHIEEDAGKLLHDEWGSGSLADYNRCGVPLIEIVSEPDIRSAEEANAYLLALKAILEFTEVSDCKMQEGSLRADVNLSIRPKGQKEFGTRTEMKNLNSFKGISRAIESEIKRQIRLIEDGEEIIQETRRWDDVKGRSYSMRSKEEAHDYRYFPEPDLVPVIIDDDWLESIKNTMPELPQQRKHKYMEKYNLPEYDASILTSSKDISDFFDRAIKGTDNIKAISNWMMVELMRFINEKEIEPSDIPIKPDDLSMLINLIDDGEISGKIAKKVFSIMFDTGKSPEMIVKEEGLEVVSNTDELSAIVQKVIDSNEKSVNDYKAGKGKALGFLMGQIMKETKGAANPQIVNQMLRDRLK